MEPNKILSASILDLVFDDRNKEYGAYELRKTYPRRVGKALMITGAIALLAFTGVALANNLHPKSNEARVDREVTLTEVTQDVKPPEQLPPPKKIEPPQVHTERLTQYTVVPNDKADDPPPTTDDLQNAKIDLKTQSGVDATGLAEPKDIGDGKGIIETKKPEEDNGPVGIVEIDAKFTGNWEKFLTRNLDPEVPVKNEAPAGRYTVMIQFVVDLEGNVSDIKPLTNHGYGMEQEAIRVLKKATKWEPAIQNGHQVKAYRRQPITFVVEGE